MSLVVGIDHSRGLCGKPDVLDDTPIERVKANPAHCLCCRSEMRIVEFDSLGLQQLGMYELICPLCGSEPEAV